jgi:hypothetical protein
MEIQHFFRASITMMLLCADITGFAQEESGTTEDLTWSLSGGTLTVSGTGEMPDYEYYYAGSSRNGCNSNGCKIEALYCHPIKLRCFSAEQKGKMTIQTACPPTRHLCEWSEGAIQIVAHVIRGNYFTFNSVNRKYGDLCSLPATPSSYPQGEAIHASTLDCFTLRVRNDVRDNLNCSCLATPRSDGRCCGYCHCGKNTLLLAARGGKMTTLKFCPKGIHINRNVPGHPDFPGGECIGKQDKNKFVDYV